MPESKKNGIEWRMVAYNVLGAVGCYLLMQLFNALLIAKEAVGEGRAPVLICLSAFLSVFLSSMVFLRRQRHGRLPLCLGCALLFLSVVLLTALAFGEGLTAWGQILTLGVSAVLGGLLAALLGGHHKSRRAARRR